MKLTQINITTSVNLQLKAWVNDYKQKPYFGQILGTNILAYYYNNLIYISHVSVIYITAP